MTVLLLLIVANIRHVRIINASLSIHQVITSALLHKTALCILGVKTRCAFSSQKILRIPVPVMTSAKLLIPIWNAGEIHVSSYLAEEEINVIHLSVVPLALALVLVLLLVLALALALVLAPVLVLLLVLAPVLVLLLALVLALVLLLVLALAPVLVLVLALALVLVLVLVVT